MNRLLILGTASGRTAAATGRTAAAALADLDGCRVLFDAGPGVAGALASLLCEGRAAIDAICLSHLQAGHVLDLGAVLHGIWTAGRTTPVALFGPPGTDRLLHGLLQAMEYDTTLRHYTAALPRFDGMVHLHIAGEGLHPLPNGLVLDAMRVPHPPCEQCFAWRLTGSRRIVVVGDAADHPPLAGFAAGANVLVHPAVHPEALRLHLAGRAGARQLADAVIQTHATLDQAVALAAAARVGQLVLSGLIPERGKRADWVARARQLWDGAVAVPRDGQEFPL